MQQLSMEERKELQRKALNSGHYEHYIATEEELRNFDVLAAMFENDDIYQYYDEIIEELIDQAYSEGRDCATIIFLRDWQEREYSFDADGNLRLNAYMLPKEDFEHGQGPGMRDVFAAFIAFWLEGEGYEVELEEADRNSSLYYELPVYLHIYL